MRITPSTPGAVEIPLWCVPPISCGGCPDNELIVQFGRSNISLINLSQYIFNHACFLLSVSHVAGATLIFLNYNCSYRKACITDVFIYILRRNSKYSVISKDSLIKAVDKKVCHSNVQSHEQVLGTYRMHSKVIYVLDAVWNLLGTNAFSQASSSVLLFVALGCLDVVT